jgi:hypothetical protein
MLSIDGASCFQTKHVAAGPILLAPRGVQLDVP